MDMDGSSFYLGSKYNDTSGTPSFHEEIKPTWTKSSWRGKTQENSRPVKWQLFVLKLISQVSGSLKYINGVQLQAAYNSAAYDNRVGKQLQLRLMVNDKRVNVCKLLCDLQENWCLG